MTIFVKQYVSFSITLLNLITRTIITRKPQSTGMQQFSNSSEICTIPCSNKNFTMISQESLCSHTNTLKTPTLAISENIPPRYTSPMQVVKIIREFNSNSQLIKVSYNTVMLLQCCTADNTIKLFLQAIQVKIWEGLCNT